ncbi:DNA mismatch repair endonuclease MutL [Desulfotruncus alcoholivorax]|uniref:DNA mismatch repair endonuclease MutL n=1 Tax=Desulfotruncus alcoholivorax TaxID=265477 RepID=UPI00040A987E|nr:DNA mismatch repair endonuclease MutL [Desulfotruncus alcoholivorax]
MPKIIILDENTACRIAAGEVVERPLSVVKELVENSLDAGAGNITVSIAGGGLESITVVDNGCGISQEDVPLAFQRHATSKIKTAGDLYQIQTLGFRGEALPSIAAVSDLLIKTRIRENSEGYYLNLRGGKLIEEGPVGCQVGTTVTVRKLFFNTPARLKHLKSKATEIGLINELLYKMALINSGVGFILTHNGRQIFQSPGSAKLLETVAAVYGVNAASVMVPLEFKDNEIQIEGYISKPELSRSSRQQITTAVNGRLVRSFAINSAIEEGYRGLLTVGRYPVAVLLLQMPPGVLDVNIHPAKMEIKIEAEEKVLSLITTAVRSALREVNLIPGFSRVVHEKVSLPPSEEPYHLDMLSIEKTKPESQQKFSLIPSSKESAYLKKDEGLKNSSKNYLKQDNLNMPEQAMQFSTQDNVERQVFAETVSNYLSSNFPELRVVGQLINMYIIASSDAALYIIDQHAAHERVLFEKYFSNLQNGNAEIQYLLAPVNVNLKYYELELLAQHSQSLKALGFVFEEFGKDAVLLRGIPADCSAVEAQQIIADMMEILVDTGKLGTTDLNYKLASLLACKAAIKGGESLSIQSMQTLINLLSKSKEPYTCPHGRPTVISFSRQELNAMFKRT